MIDKQPQYLDLVDKMQQEVSYPLILRNAEGI